MCQKKPQRKHQRMRRKKIPLPLINTLSMRYVSRNWKGSLLMDDLETMEQEAETMWDMTQPPQMKRGRGRPKGSQNKAQNKAPMLDPILDRATSGLNEQDSTSELFADMPPEMADALAAIADDQTPKPRGGAKITKLEKNLRTYYMSVGFAVSYLNATDGLIIVSMANARAHEVYQYAQHHPDFKDFLETFLERSDLVMLIGGHLTMASAIMKNHNLIPKDVAKSVIAKIKSRVSIQQEKDKPTNGFGPFRFEQRPGANNYSEWQ